MTLTLINLFLFIYAIIMQQLIEYQILYKNFINAIESENIL